MRAALATSSTAVEPVTERAADTLVRTVERLGPTTLQDAVLAAATSISR